jgi:hypothetical protein
MIATSVPTLPDVGVMLVIESVESTVKAKLLLATPRTFTMTLPLVAPAGTGTVIVVSLQAVGVAVVPLNVMVLVP